jgi:hypothetical protein
VRRRRGGRGSLHDLCVNGGGPSKSGGGSQAEVEEDAGWGFIEGEGCGGILINDLINFLNYFHQEEHKFHMTPCFW